jgi:hypothetical protein
LNSEALAKEFMDLQSPATFAYATVVEKRRRLLIS